MLVIGSSLLQRWMMKRKLDLQTNQMGTAYVQIEKRVGSILLEAAVCKKGVSIYVCESSCFIVTRHLFPMETHLLLI